MTAKSNRHLLIDGVEQNIKNVMKQIGVDPEASNNLREVSMIKKLKAAPVVLISNPNMLPEVDNEIIQNCPAPAPFDGTFIFETVHPDLTEDHVDDRVFYICTVNYRHMHIKIMTLTRVEGTNQSPREYSLKATEDWRWRLAKADYSVVEAMGDDVGAYREAFDGVEDDIRRTVVTFLMTMNANNMEMINNPPHLTKKERINLARGKLNTRPLPFYTVQVGKSYRKAKSEEPLTQGASKITHLRRAHLRRYQATKNTFIPCVLINAGQGNASSQLWVL